MRCCRCGAQNETVNPQNRRCADCQRAYVAEWRKLSKERTVRAGYNMGFQEARERIIAELEKVGPREMNGFTAAALVRQFVVA